MHILFDTFIIFFVPDILRVMITYHVGYLAALTCFLYVLFS